MNNYLIFLFSLFCFGCANIAPISGGPKDTSPPKLIYSTSKIDFSKKTILYEFNEKIQENNFQKNFYTSPVIGKFSYTINKNFLEIKIEDSIYENSIYNVSLSNCIKDVTEGNINKHITSDFLTYDKNERKIHFYTIKGSITNSFSSTKESNHYVLLYNYTLPDSNVFKSMPLYITKTDQAGNFKFQNLKKNKYKIFSISGNDYVYNNNEEISFHNKIIDVEKDSICHLLSFNPHLSIDSIKNESVDTQSNSSLTLNLKKEGDYIICLIKNEKIVFMKSFEKTRKIRLQNISPSNYTVRLIIDENNNGFWDSGSLTKNILPEKTFSYPEEIQLRKNWDLILSWDLITDESKNSK